MPFGIRFFGGCGGGNQCPELGHVGITAINNIKEFRDDLWGAVKELLRRVG